MSTQARASLVQPHRLAGATILQLVPDDDDRGRQCAHDRPIAAAGRRPPDHRRPQRTIRRGVAFRRWRMAQARSRQPQSAETSPQRRAAREHSSRASASISCTPITPARPGARSRRPRSSRSGSSPIFPTSSPRSAVCARFYQTSLARGDHVIVHSSFTAAPMIERFDIARERITVVPNPIDAQLFDPATMRPDRVLALRKAWKIPRGDRIILVPGPIAESAGQSVLVDAARLIPAGLLRNVIFVLLGDMNTGRGYVRTLNKRIAAHGSRRSSDCRGVAPTGRPRSRPSDIVAMPAIEPQIFGRPIPESQAMARPVIASAIGILPENILAPPRMPDALRTGWLVRPGGSVSRSRALCANHCRSISRPIARWRPGRGNSRNSCFRRKTLPLRSSISTRTCCPESANRLHHLAIRPKTAFPIAAR